MPSPEYLVLDSDAAILHMRGQPKVRAAIDAGKLLILPLPALAELLLGLELSQNRARTQRELDTLIPRTNVFLPDEETAATYSRVVAKLRREGRPIPVNDAWNAAIALQLGLPLAARDEHFEFVDGLELFPV